MDLADLATHLLVPIVLPDPVLEHFDFALGDFDRLFRQAVPRVGLLAVSQGFGASEHCCSLENIGCV